MNFENNATMATGFHPLMMVMMMVVAPVSLPLLPRRRRHSSGVGAKN